MVDWFDVREKLLRHDVVLEATKESGLTGVRFVEKHDKTSIIYVSVNEKNSLPHRQKNGINFVQKCLFKKYFVVRPPTAQEVDEYRKFILEV